MPGQRRTPREGPKPEARRPKNTQADREFIQANVEDFMEHDGHLLWKGRARDIGSPYQLPPADKRCVRERTMRDDDGGAILDWDKQPLKLRCPKWAMIGTDICVDHAKGSTAVMSEVRKRIVGAADALAGEMIRIALMGDTEADRLKAINSLLDRAGLKGGMEISVDEDSWEGLRKLITGSGNDGVSDDS